MSFLTSLISVMNGDPSINTLITGDIIYDSLPVNFDYAKDWIVYGFDTIDNVNTLSLKNVLTNYELNVKVLSQNIESIENISDLLINYLINVDNGLIRSIKLNSEERYFDPKINTAYKELSFNVLYTG